MLNDLDSYLQARIEQLLQKKHSYSLDYRRSSAGIADATIFVAGHTQTVQETVFACITKSEFVESARLTKGKVTIRFADEEIEKMASKCLRPGQGILAPEIDAGLRKSNLVDYCDPNANKPLHLGHLRNLAIGNSIVTLLRRHGQYVHSQMIVCDIGRSICEALAGLEVTGCYATFPQGVKADTHVGSHYASYVNANEQLRHGVAMPVAPETASPIARELTVQNDIADKILARWLDNDKETVDFWKRVVNAVMSGQMQTLDRIGITFDRMFFESDSLQGIDDLVANLAVQGLLCHHTDGAVSYVTNEKHYPYLLLKRPDRFPTEHLRAAVLWVSLQSSPELPERYIHVMGDEWTTTTTLREKMCKHVASCPLFQNPTYISHGMVYHNRETMKSSSGSALLVDDVLDLVASCDHTRRVVSRSADLTHTEVAKLVALGYFLTHPPSEQIHLSIESLLNFDGPIWKIASAFADATLILGRSSDCSGLNEQIRNAFFQCLRLRRLLSQTRVDLATHNIMRFTMRVAEQFRSVDCCYSRTILASLLCTCLTHLGLTDRYTNVTINNRF